MRLLLAGNPAEARQHHDAQEQGERSSDEPDYAVERSVRATAPQILDSPHHHQRPKDETAEREADPVAPKVEGGRRTCSARIPARAHSKKQGRRSGEHGVRRVALRDLATAPRANTAALPKVTWLARTRLSPVMSAIEQPGLSG